MSTPQVWLLFTTTVTHEILIRPITGDVISRDRTLQLNVRPSALVFTGTAKKRIFTEARRKSSFGMKEEKK